MRRPIEETEAEIMKYITLHMQDRAGMAPSLAEIGTGVGIAASTAQRYVRMLVKQGLVVRTQHGLFARNINLPEAVWLPSAPAPVEVPQYTWRTMLASIGARLSSILS